jgi:hypothetical protein
VKILLPEEETLGASAKSLQLRQPAVSMKEYEEDEDV